MSDSSGRIVQVEAPPASPGCCGICGVSKHDQGFAAADLHFEFYGTLIFCYDCVGAYARVFGYLSSSETADLRAQANAQAEELVVLRQAILGLEAAVDGLTSVRSLGVGYVAESAPLPVAEEPPLADEEPADSGAGEQLTLDELATEQGRDDVQHSTDSDELADLLK